MRLRDSLANLISLVLLLIGAALVFVWLASTMGPRPDPPEPGVSARSLLETTSAAPTPAGPTLQITDATPTALPPLFTPTPWSLNPELLTIVPLYPRLDETISVEVQGVAPADCHPQFQGYAVLETGYVPVDLAQPAGAACTEPESPWSVTLTMDPLPPGHWLMEIYVDNEGDRVRHAAHTIYVAPPGPTPIVTPTTVGDFPTRTPFASFTQQLEIVPENPTSNDIVRLLISGASPDSCLPEVDQVSIAGPRIQVDLSVPNNASTPCIEGMTQWSRDVELGPLPANTYFLDVYVDAGADSSLLGGSFVVTP